MNKKELTTQKNKIITLYQIGCISEHEYQHKLYDVKALLRAV